MSESLFTSQTPALPNVSEGAPVTVGNTITFSATGTVTGARFYGPSTVGAGSYQAVLWSVDTDDAPAASGTGTVLGTPATFGVLTAGAWNAVSFASPIAVTSGVAYRISVRSSEGRYCATSGFWASALTSGNITGIQDGTNPVGIGTLANGAFIESTTTYPNKTFGSNGYFVDVVFTADASGVSPTGLAIPLTLGSPTVALGINPQPSGLAIPISFGSPAVTTPAQPEPTPVSANRGGWFGLLAIAQEAREMRREDRARQPIECPHDGQPLDMNAEGVLHCPYDGWTWNGSEVL